MAATVEVKEHGEHNLEQPPAGASGAPMSGEHESDATISVPRIAGRTRVVIIGGGFSGYFAAKTMARHADRLDIILINETDYFLYQPLLPEVAAGLLEPARICVSLRRWVGRVRLQLGTVDRIDVAGKTVRWIDPDGRQGQVDYDRLLITVGSVNKLLPIPGVSQYAHGLRGVSEALFLRDHMTRQVELAGLASDELERDARLTFVVVGGGYTGTEMAAQGQLYTSRLARSIPSLRTCEPRWILMELAPRLLPELAHRLSATAERVLSGRGVDVRLGDSVKVAHEHWVTLTTEEKVNTRSLIWCVGVRPDPIVSGLELPVDRGRVVVDEHLQVPDHPAVFASGDCAAVPDLTRPGEICGMTAQHATRQGRRAALNILASVGTGQLKRYKHRDLGFLVDLGGLQAAANPLGLPISGVIAKAVTRCYHVKALPGNRQRVAVDWAMNLTGAPPAVQLGMVHPEDVVLDAEGKSTLESEAPAPSSQNDAADTTEPAINRINPNGDAHVQR